MATAQALPIAERRSESSFQHYALFEHMTVFDNVAFGLKRRHAGRAGPPRKPTFAGPGARTS